MSWIGGWLGGGTGGGGGGLIDPPVVNNITPADGVEPGGAGAFSVSYGDARFTPIEFDIHNIAPGASVSITAKFENRDETYVALDFDGTWRWPFDADSTIAPLTTEPVHVSLLPRDGWPPVPFTIQVAAVRLAVEE